MEKQSRTNKMLVAGYAATANWATTVALAVAMLALSIMTFIVTGDVILRYVFNAPTKWVTEVSSYLLVVIVLMGLAHTQRERGHIKVDIILSRLPKAVRSWAELVILVVVLGLTIILTYLTAGDFWMSVKLKSFSDSLMAFPLAPWQVFIPVGFAVLALLLIWEIYTMAIKIKRREYKVEGAPKPPQESA